ncbi:ARSB [Symbiodinium microadriaticum]|nr:ARSB [Symbiodinium microadriaticum]
MASREAAPGSVPEVDGDRADDEAAAPWRLFLSASGWWPKKQALVSEAYKLINTTQLTCSGAMALLAWPLLLSLWSSTLAKRPHIIFHVIDDFGWDDSGFRNGNQIQTPTLNMFHERGVTLDQYYVLPSCSPSRATFMTGRMPLHTGINNWIPNEAYGLPLNETTLPSLLGGLGYRRHAVGKWHLGFFKTEYTPTYRGFESFYGYYEGSEDYFLHVTSGGYDLHREPTERCGAGCTQVAWGDVGQYSTKLFAEEAVRIIEGHNASEPLFLYQAWQGVHSPREAPPAYVKPYEHTIEDPDRRTFAGMVTAVDEGIGNVTRALEAKGMLSDAIIVVTTDNGGPVHECAGIGASNFPLRGGKCSIWEGGTRGTAMVYAPAVMTEGFTYSGLVHAADWLPSLVEGVAMQDAAKIPAGATLPLDGLNLWHALVANKTSPRRDLYYGITDQSVGHHGPALRSAEGWKLICGTGGGTGDWPPRPGRFLNESSRELSTLDDRAHNETYLLFDLRGDPAERSDISASHPELVQSLLADLRKYEATAAPQATGDPSCPPFRPRHSKLRPYLGPWCDKQEIVV